MWFVKHNVKGNNFFANLVEIKRDLKANHILQKAPGLKTILKNFMQEVATIGQNEDAKLVKIITPHMKKWSLNLVPSKNFLSFLGQDQKDIHSTALTRLGITNRAMYDGQAMLCKQQIECLEGIG